MPKKLKQNLTYSYVLISYDLSSTNDVAFSQFVYMLIDR